MISIRFNLILFLAAWLTFHACSSIQTAADYDKSVDFSEYTTFEYYGWADSSDRVLTPFDKKRIEEAVAEELYSRGMSYVEFDGEAVVALFIVFDQRKSATDYTDFYTSGPYTYAPRWGWGPGQGYDGTEGSATANYTEDKYQVGTLIIDIWDKAERRLVWQGIGSKIVDEDPDSREENIRRAVAAIMKKYPVER